MSVIRILHVSDLHARPEARPDQLRLVEAMLEDAARAHAEQEIHLAVVSGDLSYSGQLEELFVAQELLLDGLTTRLGLPRERVVILPGNHDVDRTAIDRVHEAGLRALLTIPEEVNRIQDAPDALAVAAARLEAFDTFRADFYDGCVELEARGLAWLTRFEVEGHSIGVAAMNSSWRCSGDDDHGRLLLGERQLFAALDGIDACDVRIAAFHHPLSWLAPWDADVVRRELEKRLTIVLTGHEHESDPTAETSTRGHAIYNRVGCLFEAMGYHNSFAIIDADPAAQRVEIAVRTWWPKRNQFDAAVDLCEGGQVRFDLGSHAPILKRQPSYTVVQSALAEVAQRGSLLADQLPDLKVQTVDDVLVAPRFWSIPYSEVVAAATASRSPSLPDEVDPAAALASDVAIVSGEAESGVTSALVWLLSRRFQTDGDRLPVYLSWDPRFKDTRFERVLRRALRAEGHVLEPDDPLPACVIALDDVTSDAKALGALADYVKRHPQHAFVLGVHGEAHVALTEQLEARELACETLFLGSFGRRQLRQITQKLLSDAAPDMVDRVLNVVNDQALPRTPFIMVALLAVLAANADPAALNVSGVLNSYIGLLLGRDDAGDLEGLGMDYRRREHLLGWLAATFEKRRVTSLARLDMESELIDYFRRKGWAPQHSAGRVIDSLIRRRVLMEDTLGVGFRHPALQSLFAAKATRDDAAFAASVIQDPLSHAAIVTHVAGLERSNQDLLEATSRVTRDALTQVADEVTVDMFDRIENRPGWSSGEEDLEELKALLDEDEDADVEIVEVDDDEDDDSFEDAMDQLDESWAAHRYARAYDGPQLPPEIQALARSTSMLLNVLRNSELVDDLPLKVDALKEIIHGWSLLAIVAAVREAESEKMAQRLIEHLGPDLGQDVKLEQWARFAELMLMVAVVTSLNSHLAVTQLREACRAVVADEAFMADSVHALLATMLYCEIGGTDWVARLAALYEQHHSHPIVSELTFMWALNRYHGELTTPEEADLAHLLADSILDSQGDMPAAARGQQRGALLNDLRRERRLLRTRRRELEESTDAATVAA